MPFTPYHLGPGIMLGVLLFRWIDVVAVLVGSVILDLEPFVILVTGMALPLHGTCHTYLAAGLLSIPTSAALMYLRPVTGRITRLLGLEQDFPPTRVYASCLVGTTSHVFLDSFLYEEMNPFYPILGNPLYGYLSSSLIYQSCFCAGMVALLIYLAFVGSRTIIGHRGKNGKDAQNT